MNHEIALQIAEKNLQKAEKKFEINCNRKGITEVEISNLKRNIDYAKYVYELILVN